MPKFRKAKKGDEAPEKKAPETSSEDTPEKAAKSSEPDLEKLEREKQEAEDNWKRALADYKNLRKRTLVDIDNAVRGAKQGMLSELLLVLDYLEMALSTECETQEGKNLLFGGQMTRDQMMQFLEAQNVRPIDSTGSFDPTLHQAIESVAAGAVAPGPIVETVRRGFHCGEHVLRHSQVKVAGDPAAEAAEAEIEPADSEPADSEPSDTETEASEEE